MVKLKDDKKPAHYSELLERNPHLKKNWFTRIMVGAIVLGARTHPIQWPQVRVAVYCTPILVLVFLYNYIYAAEDTSQVKQIGTLFLIYLLLILVPLNFAVAYGYWNKDKIDTTGGVKVDFSSLKRYGYLWALIGVGFSTGVGFFGWFSVK